MVRRLRRSSRRRSLARSNYFMAARPFTAMRRRTRSRSKSSYSGSVLNKVIGAGIYGAVREFASIKLAPLTQKIPLGSYSDEAGMLAANYALGKYIHAARPVTDAGILIESARIGSKLVSGFNTTGSSSSATW